MTDPTATAERLVPYAQSTRKPVLASWMGGPAVAAGDSILNGSGIPTFDYPDTAARVFTNMWSYTYNLRSIYETPEPAEDESADRERAEEIIGRVRDSGRTILTEFEAEASPRRLRHPDRRDGGGPQPGRGRGAGRRDSATPSSSSSTPRPSPTRPTSAACA